MSSSDYNKSSNSSSAPAEVDLLNLEVELNSLQEGLETIHHNLQDSIHAPFKGSTASISSDPSNPLPNKNPSSSFTFSSSAANTSVTFTTSNTVPVPTVDPFSGDHFDPFDSSVLSGSSSATTRVANSNHHLVTNNSSSAGLTMPPSVFNTSSGSGSKVTNPSFTSDPFANVDPFDTTQKYGGEGDFFNSSDPFDSPTGLGPTSTFGPDIADSKILRNSEVTSFGQGHNLGNRTMSTDSYMEATQKPTRLETNRPASNRSEDDDWKASFEDVRYFLRI